MPNDSNKPGTQPPVGRAPAPDLPFGAPSDHAEFFDILRQLEAGLLAPDRARARIMVLYQTSLGAWVRALAESHPDIAGDVTQRLLKDVAQIARDIPGGRPTPQTPPVRHNNAPDQRLKGKSLDVLRREAIVLRALLGTKGTLSLSELRDLAAASEPDIQAAALTANLDRLVKDNVIDKPRKGHYGSSLDSKAYLAALVSEIDARPDAAR